ncbi:phenoloxidase-activating factor 3-like [Portunus trituberculatus]|uniref:phenoloxidase-activating factor 3-like n=1 Tax=Portunus trituberculatus TaxID=210409 RepID=UPI001E1CB26E|nr:phenoloxidase-activating factor 3-like [Portunus trituberculatus]XP_045132394.1 phenoloxidase-activating factor 3-like [Portunus trituberculatus]XP_045132395.1 phenoloxidase-activating factor 3-like [Portunus trituberculatus]
MSPLLLLLVGVAAVTTPSHAQNDCGLPYTSQSTRFRRQAEPQHTNAAPPPTNTHPALYSKCGAVVISDRFLLTAAYCVLNPDKPVNSVRLGDLDLAKEGEANSRPADYDIELIIIHPNFTEDTQTGIRYNDLALLKTKTKIQFNEAVYPFCISRTRPAVNTTVTVSGYGYVNDSHQPTHLQEGELQVMSLDDCVAEYRTKNRYDMLQSAYPGLLQGYGVVCAGHPDRGACNGDEGGPMLRKDESGRQHLEGIISFTADVCGPGVLPSISTSVADNYDFIVETIKYA